MAVLPGLVSATSRRAPSSRARADGGLLEREAVALAPHGFGHAGERVVDGLGLRGADAQRADPGERAVGPARHEHGLRAAAREPPARAPATRSKVSGTYGALVSSAAWSACSSCQASRSLPAGSEARSRTSGPAPPV